ncbi:DUF2169 domain-containing protein [Pseudomonas sp. SCB32]|uniref:DUF2169 domain-containing protein n=1 Tax=Pseudomonas sp. SCB32 TaxID=2653853 RepID=UPI00126528E1|nr:DUF2169 domain-containing protein [Pseudomonas sp. SCB32]
MKLIKPLRLSLQHRVYRWNQQYQLGIAALALLPLRGRPHLLTEMELWRLVPEHLHGAMTPDVGIPKVIPEFLVSGNTYGRYCPPDASTCEVRVKVAGLEKRLRVTGERSWNGAIPTRAESFDQIPIDWSSTYGGQGFAENPLGKGHLEDSPIQRLPNLEPFGQHLRSPEQTGLPVSLGMLQPTWTQRSALAGDCDQRWLEEDFPGFSRNLDWRYFNLSQPDQWFDGCEEIPAGAPFELQHLHPKHALLSGNLPKLQARGFLQRKDSEPGALEEVPLRLTTLWFLPDCERVILVFHGSTRCTTFDGNDIDHLLLAVDDPDAPRSREHFSHVLEQRLAPRHGALHALNDHDLLPASLIGPGLETQPGGTAAPNAMLQRMGQRAAAQRDELATQLHDLSAKVAPAIAMPATLELESAVPPDPAQLPAYVEERSRHAREAEARLHEQVQDARRQEVQLEAKLSNDHHSTPPTPRNLRQVLETLSQQLHSEPARRLLPPQQHAELQQLLERTAPQLSSALSRGGHLLDAQPALDEVGSRQRREQIHERLSQGLELGSLLLAGANLAGMDLSRANLDGADLDSADLSGCDLSGASLKGALLSRVRLDNANLEGCDLSDANLGHARASGAILRRVNLSRSCLEHSELSDCDLSEAQLCDLQARGAKLLNLNLSCAQLRNLLLEETTATSLCLHLAQISNLTFHRCTLRDLDFSRARIRALTLIETDAGQGLSFQAAHLQKSSFLGACDLSGADFSACEMSEVCLRGARLRNADFTFSQLHQVDLSDTDLRNSRLEQAELDGTLLIRSDLRQASLRDASLMTAVLQGAALQGANLSGCNLFRADLGEARFDYDTRLDGSYLERANRYPLAPQAMAGEA